MIKLTLVKYIRQFSLKKSWQEFNIYFFQGLGIVAGSVVLAYIGVVIYGKLVDQWQYNDFFEVVLGMLNQSRGGTGNMLTMMISFNILVMAAVKMRKTGQMEQGVIPNRLPESYGIGLLIVFAGGIVVSAILVGLGSGIQDFGFGLAFYQIITTVSTLLLPAIGFYLGYHFLRRGLDMPQHERFWPVFWDITIVYLIISTLIGIITLLFVAVVLQPVLMIFSFGGSALSVVIACILVFSLLNFYMVVVSDLLLILLKQKTAGAKPIRKTNPDLLDA